MAVITDDSVLKLHTDAKGVIWYLDGDRPPRSTSLDPLEFSMGTTLRTDAVVRVLGTHENAPLIEILHNLRLQGKLARVELASPMSCSTSSRLRGDPESVLQDMRRWKAAPSQGGWHELTAGEYASYALLLAGETEGQEAADAILANHPAWPCLAIIPHLSVPHLCGLISMILDPRYFVDQQDPDRLSKLESYLGVEPSIASEPEGSPVRHRYDVVVRCWKGSQPTEQELATKPYFIWRTYLSGTSKPPRSRTDDDKVGEGDKVASRDDKEYDEHYRRARGEVRACQKFLSYLRHTWMDALYRLHNRRGEPLFEPDFFFTPAESMWFQSIFPR